MIELRLTDELTNPRYKSTMPFNAQMAKTLSAGKLQMVAIDLEASLIGYEHDFDTGDLKLYLSEPLVFKGNQ